VVFDEELLAIDVEGLDFVLGCALVLLVYWRLVSDFEVLGTVEL
jgi:hypothetical protein